MSNAALELLKNGGKAPTDMESLMAKTNTAAAEPASEDDGSEVEIDFESLKTHADIDGLVTKYDLAVPEKWSSFNKEAKKTYLKETYFEDDGEGGEASEEAGSTDPEPTAAAMVAPAEVVSEVAETASADVAPETLVTEVVVQAGDPVKAGKKPGKSKTKAEGVPPQELGDGSIDYDEMVKTIENMTRDTALQTAVLLHEQSNSTMFRLGGVLARIQDQGWFEPFETFQKYANAVHGLKGRRALYWVAIYKNTVESGIPFSKLQHLKWSKLKEFAGIMTKDNVDSWIELAEKLTVNDLIEHVRAFKDKVKAELAGTDPDEGEEPKATKTKAFKLYPDQVETVDAALAKVKSDSSIKDNSVALEHMALSYLSNVGQPINSAPPLESLNFAAYDFEALLNAVAEAFPSYTISVE